MESEFELTQLWETDMIVQFPKISAIYYGLLQAGYDFYIPERSAEHIRHIMKYRNRKHQDTSFPEPSRTPATYILTGHVRS